MLTFCPQINCFNRNQRSSRCERWSRWGGRRLNVTTKRLARTPSRLRIRSLDVDGVKGPKLGFELLPLFRDVETLARDFWTGPSAGKAWIWTAFAVLLALARAFTALFLSFIQRMFWNVLSSRDATRFESLLSVYGAAVIIGPIVITMFEWAKDVLATKWREEMTKSMLDKYMANKNYLRTNYKLNIDNPDQRLTEDVRLFTATATRLLCQAAVSVFDFVIFSLLLLRLYWPLFFVLVFYSGGGTWLITKYGSRLSILNRFQLSKEADLRYVLVRVRENAESIAFFGGDDREGRKIGERFSSAIENFLKLTGLKRNLGFFQRGYEYVPNILPCMLVAPKIFAGTMEPGAISQIIFAYNHVLGDLGLVVVEFASLSTFAANVKRLMELRTTLEAGLAKSASADELITRTEVDEGLRLINVTSLTPVEPKRMLAQKVSLMMAAGERILVCGESGIGKSSLMRIIAGIWSEGEGFVYAPKQAESFFMPQKPYIVFGSLKENVVYPNDPDSFTDEDVRETLKLVNLPALERSVGGLHNSEINLSAALSLGEQQRLSFARLVLADPSFVTLDESTSALDTNNEQLLYGLLPRDMMIISVSNKPSLVSFHDRLLRLKKDGSWTLEEIDENTVL